MMDNFLVRAALAGLGVAVAVGPLGCFVVWRRMAFFGDATAHAAILGVALALATEVPIYIGVILTALAMATTLVALTDRGHGADTLLGVMSHAALAVGLVAMAMFTTTRVDLSAYLFGDILAVQRSDVAIIWVGGLAVTACVAWRWSRLLTTTLNPDLAHAAGISPKREELALTLSLALIVAISIKVVGALLIAAMLIIPAAAARPLTTRPEVMAAAATLIAALSVLGGLYVSLLTDAPAGPSIICVSAVIFVAASTVGAVRRTR